MATNEFHNFYLYYNHARPSQEDKIIHVGSDFLTTNVLSMVLTNADLL